MIKIKKNNREIRMFKKTIQSAYSAYKTYGCTPKGSAAP